MPVHSPPHPLPPQEKPPEHQRLLSLFPELVGESPALLGMLSIIERVSASDAPVLVLGESGTGKELVGRALHRLSPRCQGPIVCESCSVFSESLLEAELFGHARGAFTGADKDRPGLIESADGGTLFLDEVGEMGAALQSRLLRVLQERVVRRIGERKSRPVDFRLIAATHRNLEEMVRCGQFRADLRFRLDVVRIEIPPLRDRVEDIRILVDRFLSTSSQLNRTSLPEITDEAWRALEGWSWPGNVRELKNEVERWLALGMTQIDAEVLSTKMREHTIPHPITKKVRDEVGSNLRYIERVILGGIVQEVLRENGGNKARTARVLGIPKTTLYRRLDRWNLARG